MSKKTVAVDFDGVLNTYRRKRPLAVMRRGGEMGMAGEGVMREFLHWECRLCAAREDDGFLGRHLANAHDWDFEARPVEQRLHASKDGTSWSENTMGYWHAGQLLGIVVDRRERDADDPMRFGG